MFIETFLQRWYYGIPLGSPHELICDNDLYELACVGDLCTLSTHPLFTLAGATLSQCPLTAYSNIPRKFFDQIASGKRNKFAKKCLPKIPCITGLVELSYIPTYTQLQRGNYGAQIKSINVI